MPLRLCYNGDMIFIRGNDMRKRSSLFLCCVFAAGSLFSFAACSDGADPSADRQGEKFSSPDVTLTVRANKTERTISDELFGVFLEDINYAGYALDDDMIANGSFTYRNRLDRWNAAGLSVNVTEGEGKLHENNPSYAGLDVYEPNATLENAGYEMVPMAAQEGTEYTFSAFVRAENYEGPLTAELTAEGGSLGSVSFDVKKSGEWVKYTGSLTAAASAAQNVALRLTFGNTGTLALDSVSLVTSENTGGIKNYLYDAIEALSPAFVRFPGGCVVEGKLSGDAVYDWKNSVGVNSQDELAPFTYTQVDETGTSEQVTTYGEPATRKPNTDIWQQSSSIDYEMSYGVGFYEYFVLCENIGASAIPVLNAGLSCMIQDGGGITLPGRYGNGIQDFIDEALDLVAFAKGDPSSSDENEAKWAQARVNMGHPEPFEMNYVGIGNEQWDKYYSFYREFLKAFREAEEQNPGLYGSVELIVGNGANFVDCENAKTGAVGLAKSDAIQYRMTGKIENLSEYGVHDHHYYMNYVDFLANTDLYDSYAREGADFYKVFVGEYSANKQNDLSGYPNAQTDNSWMTALAEAAYMTGLERNGDVVCLAAYAPMFGCTEGGYNQWTADMMFYTNTELVLTPNYYVQQLFMHNTGDALLAVSEKYASFVNKTVYGSGTEAPALFRVVSRDEETGDIIVKLVNAGDQDADINIAVKGAATAGIADVTVLQCDDVNAVNTLSGESVSPESYTLGVNATFGYTAAARSVTVLRIRTK